MILQPKTMAAEPTKEVVVDAVPKRIKELKFGALYVSLLLLYASEY